MKSDVYDGIDDANDDVVDADDDGAYDDDIDDIDGAYDDDIDDIDGAAVTYDDVEDVSSSGIIIGGSVCV